MSEDRCPNCDSDDVNRTEPRYYLVTGHDCTDEFHDEADGD